MTRVGTFALFILLFSTATAVSGEDPAKTTGWSDTAEFSLVLAQGNSESESLGIRNLLERTWPKARFEFDLHAIRAASTDVDTVAVGLDGSEFEVIREEDEDVATELYSLALGFEKDFHERSFWLVGASWMQNRPAEIKSRSTIGGGFGTRWVDSENTSFTTKFGLTYTREEFTFSALEVDEYAGLRAFLGFERKLTVSTAYESKLQMDQNLDNTSDFRTDWTNALSVSINDKLALKVGIRLLYDAEPALEALALEFPRGTPTGINVFVPVDDLDTLFTSSLVVNF